MVLKLGCATLVLCALGGSETCAQTTNGIPIVHRIHRYSGRVQLLGGQAAEVPPPPPSDDDLPIPGLNKDAKVAEEMKTKGAMLRASQPIRRMDLKKDKNRPEDDAIKSLFVIDATTTNKADPEMKKWGWLAEEADISRQRLESYKKPNPDEESWTNSLAGKAKTNETKRTDLGSLRDNHYEPLATTHTTTSSVNSVVEDRVARNADKRKQDESRNNLAQRDGKNLAEQRGGPALFTATNESLGLTRSRKDDPPPDASLNDDFSQTRKTMAEITSRYQLGLTMADILRPPAKPATDMATASPGTMRVAVDNENALGRGETRRPATFGEATPNMTTGSREATLPSSGGPEWIKSPSGKTPQAMSASTMVEGPKMPKASDFSSGTRPTPPPQPTSSTLAPAPLKPVYSPGGITPSFTPGGAYTPGSLAPTFKPTTPYKSLFDTTPSR